MCNHNHQAKVQEIRALFEEFGTTPRSLMRVATELCQVATTVERLECVADKQERLPVFVAGSWVFDCTVDRGKSKFRSLLAVMFGLAKQFAEHALAPEISPY